MALKITPKSGHQGFSLAELLMAMTVFSIMVLLSVSFLSGSSRLWGKVDSSVAAGTTLTKACWRVQTDLDNAGRQAVGMVGNGTGAGKMGDALWLLSAVDPDNGAFIRTAGGNPLWQRNVLYYLTVPLDHDTRFGQSCQSWHRVCPHKILLRKVIDSGPTTTPTSPIDDQEQLLSQTDITTYLTRPATLELAGMTSEPGVASVDYVAGGMLDTRASFRDSAGAVLSGPGPTAIEVRYDLEAALVEAARKEMVIGVAPFDAARFTLTRTVAVVPTN